MLLILANALLCVASAPRDTDRAQVPKIVDAQQAPATNNCSDIAWTPAPDLQRRRFPAHSLTFTKDIAPIIYANCTGCHQAGEKGISLASYEEVRKHAKNIASVTLERYMPPWKPEPGYGDFVDGRRLTDDEINAIAQWVEEGTARGEGAMPDAPAARKSAWKQGPPDRVLTTDTYVVPGDGAAHYRVFVVPLHNRATLYLEGVEVLPNNRQVTHHVDILSDSSGKGLHRDAREAGAGYESFGGPGMVPDGFIGGYSPGSLPIMSPPETAFELKPNSSLLLVTHFTPSGKAEPVRLSVGLHVFDGVPSRKQISVGTDTHDVDLAPGARDVRVSFSELLASDADLLSIFPHGHNLCREMRVRANTPDGRVIPLIWVRDFDLEMQRAYVYRRPVRLPAGTLLSMDYYYDNSAENRRNPNNPPKRVKWGEATSDEMADCHFQWSPVTPADELAMREVQERGVQQDLDRDWHGEKGGFQSIQLKKKVIE